MYNEDIIIATEAERMFNEVLKEVISPNWKPPEGMVIIGNAPPEAIAKCIVNMRLHMREHNN